MADVFVDIEDDAEVDVVVEDDDDVGEDIEDEAEFGEDIEENGNGAAGSRSCIFFWLGGDVNGINGTT